MQPWFEFAPFATGSTINFVNNSWCNFEPYTTTGGVKKVARYRYNFLSRRTPDSESNFTNVFNLIDAASSSGTANYVANMENMADMENWMRVFAANHAAGNWDAIGGSTGQNVYGYVGTQGTKYSLLMWDFNLIIGNSQAWLPGQNLFTLNGEDPNMSVIYNTPVFLRMYWRALQELVNGPLDPANSGPLLAAKYNVMTANGLAVENPTIESLSRGFRRHTHSIAAQLAAGECPGVLGQSNRQHQQRHRLRERNCAGECCHHLDQRRGISRDLDQPQRLDRRAAVGEWQQYFQRDGRGSQRPADSRRQRQRECAGHGAEYFTGGACGHQ